MRLRKRKWVDPYLNEDKEYLKDNLVGYNFNNSKVYLEIGMGMGDFIIESCLRNPNITYIGFEKDATCVAKTIVKAKEQKISNLIVIHNDANLINELIDNNSIDVIYLHFSDPWPKKGHNKRRLTYKTFLEKYKLLLKKDGYIIYKTDNLDFFNDSLEYFEEMNMDVRDINYDYHSVKRDEPLTGYESKFVSENKPINYAKLRFKEA